MRRSGNGANLPTIGVSPKRARGRECSAAFPKGGDIPGEPSPLQQDRVVLAASIEPLRAFFSLKSINERFLLNFIKLSTMLITFR